MRKYEEPKLEVQMFSIEDVITESIPNISNNPLDAIETPDVPA